MGGHHSQFTEEELKDYQVKQPFINILDISAVSAIPHNVNFAFGWKFMTILTSDLNVFTIYRN